MAIILKTKHKIIQGSMPGPMATEWWTEEDYKKWNKHVDELKESGEYGKEVEFDVSLTYNPDFFGHLSNYVKASNYEVEGPQEQIKEELSKPVPDTSGLESYSIEILDFGKDD